MGCIKYLITGVKSFPKNVLVIEFISLQNKKFLKKVVDAAEENK